MKFSHPLAILLMTATLLSADEPALGTPKDLAEHHEGSKKLSKRQDELSADVQQLAIEQTVEKVIALLKECEDIMGEATDNLDTYNTGGETIAAQTEVIEKIYEAAKEKQKQQQQGQGQSQSGSAMMDMMERMMGKSPGGDKPGEQKGNQPGDKGGQGQTGDSDSANSANGGAGDGKSETRRVPKSAGVAGKTVPEEFRSALDA